MRPFDEMDQRAVAAMRVLAVDEVEKARSGHPGMPLGASPMAYVLWSRFLRHDPADPVWPDRDRFVLSAGHASAMLYALLHLFGYDLPLEELKRFRQWGSQTPGHPEHGLTPGVECTTGPLGQGLATAVGMALAERHLAARFNRDGMPVVDHRTWVIASDGDMMEGISHEAASLAGHLRLGRLMVLYDDNRITIEGSTDLAFSENVEARFAAYGWRTFHVDDGNDLAAIAAALDAGRRRRGRARADPRPHPHRLGQPQAGQLPRRTASRSGPRRPRRPARALGWTIAEPFVIPEEIRQHFRAHGQRGAALHGAWVELLERYRQAYPGEAAEFERRLAGELPAGWDEALPSFPPGSQLATRQASGKTLNALAPRLPELFGGSADLAPSTDTLLAGEASVAPGSYEGRNLHFGIREHAMAAAANGVALHGGMRPYVATFLVFSDYLRPAMRLAALMKLPVIYVFTHDSIGLGEDGPTHQPVEHLVALRVIPNLVVLRPADANETVQAWRAALERRDGPTALVLTRQKLPVLPPPPAGAVARGAYIRAEAACGAPEVVLIGTGSEVALALAVREELEAHGVPTRVVSAPSLELLGRQSDAYQREVLGPRHALRVAIEAGRGQGWHRWVGDGEIVSLNRFGASAPGPEVMAHLGYSVAAVAARVHRRSRRPQLVADRGERAGGVAPGGRRRPRAPARRTRRRTPRRPRQLGVVGGRRRRQHVARRLGWLDLPDRSRRELPELERLVAALAADGARTLVLLGMGGSSLAPEVLRATFGTPAGRDLVVLDTTDPDRVGEALRALDPASRRGRGDQQVGHDRGDLRAARDHVGRRPRRSRRSAPAAASWRSRSPARRSRAWPASGGSAPCSTTPWTSAGATRRSRRWASSRRCGSGHPSRTSWPPASALSRASATATPPSSWRSSWGPSRRRGGASSPGRRRRRSARSAPGPSSSSPRAPARTGAGILPVVLGRPPAAGEAWPGTVYLSPRFADEGTTALDRALDGVAATNPVARWRLAPDGLGEAFVTLELATALAGYLLGVNPFDEPDVLRAKERARAALAGGRLALPPATPAPRAALAEHLRGVGADDAVVLLAYLPERPDVAAALAALARAVSASLRVPVTAAFGPRYLHSTGQLHKGGPAHIVPVVLTGAPGADLPIPGQAHTLGQLRLAQAIGDIEALAEVGRKVLHLHLDADPVGALAELAAGW